MSITRITSNKKRRGVSTVLGTLVFIGILFTAVIPMTLVMKQADTIYDQKKLEINRFDEEHERENIEVSVYPTGGAAPDNLTVNVENRCEMPVKIVRIWINDTIHSKDTVLQSMKSQVVGSYNVDPKNGSVFDIFVTTERGNVYETGSGPVTHDGWDWVVEQKLLNVLISSPGIVFKIYVTGPNNFTDFAQVWKIGGSAFKSFDITDPGNGWYNVQVKRGNNIIHEEDVEMKWPNGPSIIWVYA